MLLGRRRLRRGAGCARRTAAKEGLQAGTVLSLHCVALSCCVVFVVNRWTRRGAVRLLSRQLPSRLARKPRVFQASLIQIQYVRLHGL